jgi:hypothetical protein
MMRVILLGLGLVLAPGSLARAQTVEFRVCIGEREANCPVAHNAWFGCGTSFDDAARQLCTVTRPDGQRSTSAYRIIPQGSAGGNRCGYSWGIIQCIGQ